MPTACLTQKLFEATKNYEFESEEASMSIDLRFLQEQLFFNTVRISIKGKKGSSIGTGFIVKYRLPYDPEKFYTFVVSCKHVFGDPNQNILLNFHKLDPNTESEKPKLGETIAVEAPFFKDAYFTHPDPETDLACIQISGIMDMIRKNSEKLGSIFFLATEPEHFSAFNEEGLLPGTRTFYIGYPAGEFDELNNLPLLRVGHVSSIPKIDYRGTSTFVIDGQVHPGSSGSPVFGIFNSSTRLLGVLTAMITQDEPSEERQDGSVMFTRHRLGSTLTISGGVTDRIHQTIENRGRN